MKDSAAAERKSLYIIAVKTSWSMLRRGRNRAPQHAANCDYPRNVNCFTTDTNSNFCPNKNRQQLKLVSTPSYFSYSSLSTSVCSLYSIYVYVFIRLLRSAQLQLLPTLALLQSGNVIPAVYLYFHYSHLFFLSRQSEIETVAEPANYPTHRRYFGWCCDFCAILTHSHPLSLYLVLRLHVRGFIFDRLLPLCGGNAYNGCVSTV